MDMDYLYKDQVERVCIYVIFFCFVCLCYCAFVPGPKQPPTNTDQAGLAYSNLVSTVHRTTSYTDSPDACSVCFENS